MTTDIIATIVLWVVFTGLAATALSYALDPFKEVTGPRRAVIPTVLAVAVALIIAARSVS